MNFEMINTEVGPIPASWSFKKIGETDIIIGDGNYSSKYPKASQFLSSGVPFISAINLNGRSITTNGLRYISASQHDTLRKGHLKKGDVIVVVRGNGVGEVALVPNDFEGANINAQLAFLRSQKETDGGYLYYLLSSEEYLQYIRNFASGSAQPQLPIKSLKEIKLVLPPFITQKKIATVLSGLDNKIELNRKANQTLEAIAQAIFKEWFVDFNFPGATGELVESELGMIPKGWRVGKLGEDGEFKNGINYSRDEKGDTQYSIINVRDVVENKFLSKSILDNINVDARKAKPYLIEEDDIIIVRSASPGETAIILNKEEKIIYSGFTIRYRLSNKANFLYYFFIFQNLKMTLDNLSNGTTLKNINQEMLKAFPVIVPDMSTISSFSKVINPIFQKIVTTNEESKSLTQLRDTLLPKLIKGEIALNELD